MHKKLRQRLEKGRPIYLINSSLTKHDLLKSLELEHFEASIDRLSWIVRCGNGQLLSGGIGDSREIPFLPGAKICMAIPIKLHRRSRNMLCPDFIIEMPSSYITVSELASIR
jgi:hypothetical protein